MPARATANSATVIEPVASAKAPNTAALITSAVYTADSKPIEMPARITVAAPVSEDSPTVLTGLSSVPVK